MKLATWIQIGLIVALSFTASEKNEFVPLFNGKDLTGWFVKNGGIESWRVSDGILSSVAEGGDWLTYDKEFSNFILRVEWRIPADGNSGVGLRYPVPSHVSADGMEIQILDDHAEKHRDLKPAQFTGSIYCQVAAKQHAAKPVGEWNLYEITCDGPKVIVVLNGIEVVNINMDEHTVGEGDLTPLSQRPRSGHVGVQCHNTGVDFRRIEIRELHH